VGAAPDWSRDPSCYDRQVAEAPQLAAFSRQKRNGPGVRDTEAVRISFSPRKLFSEMPRVFRGE
jgi:hypothetical protein